MTEPRAYSPRASSLEGLARCAGLHVIRAAEGLMGSDRSGAAAQTGSAVGRVVELWHRQGEIGFDEALSAARSEQGYADARWDDVREMALGYCADARNRGCVVPEWQEIEIRAEIPPAPEDPTGEPVVLVGHPDQIRRSPLGELRVWDLKSGMPDGQEMQHSHAWQVAAYAIAATATLGQPVLPGGLIRLRGYTTGKPPSEAAAHYPMMWSLEQCSRMMEAVAYEVAQIRRGTIVPRPGAHCRWCPGKNPALCPERIDVAMGTLEGYHCATPANPLLVSQLADLAACAAGRVLEAPPTQPTPRNPALAGLARSMRRLGGAQ